MSKVNLIPRTVYSSNMITDTVIYETGLSVGDLKIFVNEHKTKILLIKPYIEDECNENLSLVNGEAKDDITTSTSLYTIEDSKSIIDIIKNLTTILKTAKKLKTYF